MKIINFVKSLFVKDNESFYDKVLKRYCSQEPISEFSMKLFQRENEETINRRFKEAKERVENARFY